MRRVEKLDFTKLLKVFYGPPTKGVVEVVVPPLNYLMVDGEGDPNCAPAYAEAVEALFTVAYTLKFMVKRGEWGVDYGVMPLEGLWWADDMTKFSTEKKGEWKWTMMIMQPALIPETLVAHALDVVGKKKQLPALPLVRLATLEEGRCAQIMHVGPFADEGPTIARLHAYIEASGASLCGQHHEIYLSDIRKADPAKWKTVIRQPMG